MDFSNIRNHNSIGAPVLIGAPGITNSQRRKSSEDISNVLYEIESNGTNNQPYFTPFTQPIQMQGHSLATSTQRPSTQNNSTPVTLGQVNTTNVRGETPFSGLRLATSNLSSAAKQASSSSNACKTSSSLSKDHRIERGRGRSKQLAKMTTEQKQDEQKLIKETKRKNSQDFRKRRKLEIQELRNTVKSSKETISRLEAENTLQKQEIKKLESQVNILIQNMGRTNR